MVLMLTVITGIVLTSWMYLLTSRLIQANSTRHSLSRQTVWRNTNAVNRVYAHKYQFRDGVTQVQVTTTQPALKEQAGTTTTVVNGYEYTHKWFGRENPFNTADPGMQAFRSSAVFETGRGRHNNVTAVNNRPIYITETSGSRDYMNYDFPYSTSNPSKGDHVIYFNYLKTYPRSLMGDLLVLHRSGSPASSGAGRITPGAAYKVVSSRGDGVYPNINVNGRVVFMDPNAQAPLVRAAEVHNATDTGTNTTNNISGSSKLMPENIPATPVFTDGSGDSTGGAVVDGTLNMISNSGFLPASVFHKIENTEGIKWINVSRAAQSATNFSTGGTSTVTGSGDQVGLRWEGNVNSSSDIGWAYRTLYAPTNRLNRLTVTLNSVPENVGIRIFNSSTTNQDGGVEQLILDGQTINSSSSSTANALNRALIKTPLIIWLEQDTLPQVLFNNENHRPLIILVGNRRVRDLEMRFTGSNVSGSSAGLDWRMHIINEITHGDYALRLFAHATASLNVNIIGGIRTNWDIITDTTSTTPRFYLDRETNEQVITNLMPFLPRDGWFETFVTR